MKYFALILALVASLGSNAQNIKIVFDPYYVQQDGSFDGQLLTFHDRNDEVELLRTDRKGRLNGQWVTRHENGMLKEYGVLTQGERNGVWMTFDENGVKRSEARYNMGQKDGEWFVWDENGTLRYEMSYRMGNRHGKWVVYNEHGTVDEARVY